MNLLSPAAVRRDYRPPIVDLRTPIADGLRSSARLVGGTVQYRSWEWATNIPLLVEDVDLLAARLAVLGADAHCADGAKVVIFESVEVRAEYRVEDILWANLDATDVN